ncbi:hypothetical protein MCOR02_011728 [Pyricularia oryzae]|uniref:Protein ecm33 n=1 Tax=Pyricularia oryzae TaxID=318829 RepID=A0A4V1C5X3_PYROR|nr:hypothetical protein MCOR02_011728 [Pyricularia oryzae]KAI6304505.1 hypothetical protein MCOR34_008778 [Pyricularia oryzae]KAI6442571.1 hypothetical protein MCOR22_005842 [Pyricularia oryzae]KAI6462198.1 hypothetical protein MCOR17_006000 [Pyricularia oryzae]KAI6490124.1 hypothetical protein MCOR13_008574 [Pyricularia oryzae]
MRRLPLAAALTALLLQSIPGVVAADDPPKDDPATCSNVTISSAGDARHIARACTTIVGDLHLSPDLNETVALNGIEKVTGSVLYRGRCQFQGYTNLPTRSSADQCGDIPEPFSLRSTSLRAVEGNFTINTWLGLSNIEMPHLQRVRGEFNLRSLMNLTQLDVTRLARVGDFNLEAPLLRDLKHDGLEGFTKVTANLTVRSADLDSLDSLLRPRTKPVDKWPEPDDWPLFRTPQSVALYTEDMSRLANMTVAWPKLVTLSINPNFVNETVLGAGVAPRLVLGSAEGNWTTMSIQDLVIQGVESLELHSSLTGGLVDGRKFQLAWTNTQGNFKVPFSNLTILDVFGNDKMESIELPSSGGMVQYLDELQLSGKGLLVDRLVWPKDNMSTVKLTGKIQEAAFDPFLQDRNPADVNSTTRPLVKDFAVTGHAGSNFSCEPFDRLKEQKVITGEYRCSIQSAASRSVSATFSTTTVLATVMFLLLS